MQALNLCEAIPYVARQFGTLSAFIGEMETGLGVTAPRRIYAGSYFCSLNFLHTFPKFASWLFDYCKTSGIAVTLVVPVVSERHFEAVCEELRSTMDEFGSVIDEVTVNDYGSLAWCNRNLDVKLNLGRLFFKALRDNRYHDMLEEPFVYTINDYTRKLLEVHGVSGVELDVIRSDMRIGENIGVSVAIHYPYCYMSTGMVCEFASVRRAIEKKFRPNASCEAECCDVYSYCRFDCGDPVIKLGRTLYYRFACDGVTVPNARMVLTPFDLFVDSAVWGERL